MKYFKGGLLLTLLASGLSLCAQAQGNVAAREIGDVVFRNLDFSIGGVTDVHGAVYVGHTIKTGMPSAAFSHELIEMAGVSQGGSTWKLLKGPAGEIYLDNIVVRSSGIAYENLASFSIMHSGYRGAFMHLSYPGLEIRKDILRKAQELMFRYEPIAYIVVPGDSFFNLPHNYFRYHETAGTTLTDADIERMRSDAFVEYCYASAGRPILSDNITTRAGADDLNERGIGLQPSHQMDAMKASLTGNPVLKAYDNRTNELISDVAGTTDLWLELKDFQSGPGYVSIQRLQGGYPLGSAGTFPFVLKSPQGAILLDNIAEVQKKNLSDFADIIPGYSYQIRAYDHAGNYSDLSFLVAGHPVIGMNSVSPVYNDFKGVSPVIPSTQERDHDFTFSDDTAGLSRVLMTGPEENPIDRTFDPPVAFMETSLAGMAPGDYTVRVTNAAGNESVASFNIAGLNVYVSTEGSRQVITYSSDPLGASSVGVTIKAVASATNELDRIEMLDLDGSLLESKALSGNSAEAEFALPSLAIPCPLFTTQEACAPSPSHQRELRIWDKKGNYKRETINIPMVYYNIPSYTGGLFLFTPEMSASSYSGEILDITGVSPSFLPGAIISDTYVYNYPAAPELIRASLGFGSMATRKAGGGSFTEKQLVGLITTKLYTSTSPDMANAVGYVLESGTLYAVDGECAAGVDAGGITGDLSAGVCLEGRMPQRPMIPAKRYVQMAVEFTKASPSSFLKKLCWEFNLDENEMPISCKIGLEPATWSLNKTAFLSGASLYSQEYLADDYSWVSAGENTSKSFLSGQLQVDFDRVVSSGTLSVTLTSSNLPPGFVESPANAAYDIIPGFSLISAGATRLTLKYDASALTAEQAASATILKVVDASSQKYEILPSVNNGDGSVSADVSGFGRFMVVVPKFQNPQTVSGQNIAFLSGETVVLEDYDASSPEGQGLLATIRSYDRLPIGRMTRLGPDGLQFSPNGVVRMTYSDADVAMLGVDENSLEIHQIAADGSSFARLPMQFLDKESNELMAEVPAFTSIFAVTASSIQVERIPPSSYPDVIPPTTSVAYEGDAESFLDGVLVSTTTRIVFSAQDSNVGPDVVSSGYQLTNYLLDPQEEAVQLSTYTAPFALNEGTHAMFYFSVDNSWNYEFVKSATYYADGTPPLVWASVAGSTVPDGGTAYVLEADSVTLAAMDPVSNGVASGRRNIYYLVDVTLDECPDGEPPFTGSPGTCENPSYAGPFTLEPGEHVVYYLAEDNVGNMSAVRSAHISVGGRMPEPRAWEFAGQFQINPANFATLDADGNIYAASFNEISKYAPDGTFLKKWSVSGSVWGIQSGPDGHIYAADNWGKVHKFTTDGVFVTAITGPFQSVMGLDIDKSGNVYVADPTGNQVVVLEPSGTLLQTLSAPGCQDVAVDATGNIYATDNSAKAVRKFSPEGEPLLTFQMSAGAYSVFSVELDPYGNVYALDAGNKAGNRIEVFNAAGNHVGRIGMVGTTPDGIITKMGRMEINERTGELYIPQGNKMFVYRAVEDLPAVPVLVSPGPGKIFDGQALATIQGQPGSRIEMLDGLLMAASGYIDNPEGELSVVIPLAPGAHLLSARAVSNMGFPSETTPPVAMNVESLRPVLFPQVVTLEVRGETWEKVIATTTVTGDFNGDNLTDIIAIGKYSYTALLGRGDGTFDEQLSVAYFPYYWNESAGSIEVWEAVAADVNRDGKLDFVMSSLSRILTAIGNGDGTFVIADSGYVPLCDQQYIDDTDIRVGDVNGDGYTDVVKGVRTRGTPGSCIYVLTGDGAGRFAMASTKAGLPPNDSISLLDFNGDGHLDVANGQGIWWNSAAGFADYEVVCGTCSKAFAEDFNGDGLYDLVYDYRQIRFNLGGGKFSRPADWPLNWKGNWVIGKPALVDINGDGVRDIAVGAGIPDNYGKIFVYTGYGDGRFAPEPLELYVGNTRSQIDTLSIADFNNDTRPDIAAALHFNSSVMSIPELALFFNNTLVPDIQAPAASVLSLAASPDGGVKISWTAPGDDGAVGRASRYDLRAAGAPIIGNEAFVSAAVISGLPSPATAGSPESFIAGGLAGGTTYYFALRTYDEAGNASPLSNTPGIYVNYVFTSGLVDGAAELTVTARTAPSVASVQDGAALEAALAEDLSSLGGIYSIGFGAEYDFSGIMTFRYSAAALASAGLIESEIGIYEYAEGTGWSRLEGQVLDSAGRMVIAPVNSSASVCGLFGSGAKLLSPAEGAVLYTETPLFLGRFCKDCSLKIYEGGILKGEIAAQPDGFLKGELVFQPGSHEISAEVNVNGVPLPAVINRKFEVRNPYTLKFDAPAMVPGGLDTHMGLSGLGMSDFNGDGHKDLLVLGQKGYVTALGDGAGGFTYLPPVTGGLNYVYRVENPDLNNDGKADIIAANLYKALMWNIGSGNGAFGPFYAMPNQLSIADGLGYGDFDGDGHVDAAAAGYDSVSRKYLVSALKNLGGAGFARKHLATPLQAAASVNLAQMDADGKMDILHGGVIFYGDGSGGFPVVKNFAPDCVKSATGDFNGDGYKDFACLRNYTSFVDVYVSLKNRTFKRAWSVELSATPIEVFPAADLNNDGLDDLLVGAYGAKLHVLASRGDGGFSEPYVVNLDSRINSVKVVKTGDLDEDGRIDLAVGHYFAGISPEDVSLVYNRSDGPDRTQPASVTDLVASFDYGEGLPALAWTAPGDDGRVGQASIYDLRVATIPVTADNFTLAAAIAGVPTPKSAGSLENFTVPGLASGSTWYFSLRTADEVGNISPISNIAGLFLPFVAVSSNTVNGYPEVSMVSPVQPYITQVSPDSVSWAVAIGSISVSGLTSAGNLYEIGPEGDYDPPATLTFVYSTSTLAALGLLAEDLAVYEYFSGIGWVRLDGQILDTANHKITVPITRIASLFGIFGVVKDHTPPVTSYVVDGSSWAAAGTLYTGSGSSLSLSAYDPVVYGTSSGVAVTEFRVDASSGTPFASYAGPVMPSTGAHIVEFRSVDNAGNIETAQSFSLFVDNIPPAAAHSFAGPLFLGGDVLYAAPSSTLTVTSLDDGAGVAALYYAVNGSTFASPSGSVKVAISSTGEYAVEYHAVDNLGNAGERAHVFFHVDDSVPSTEALLAGTTGQNGWYVSPVAAALVSTDALSGVATVYYSLGGAEPSVYASTLTVAVEGAHPLVFHAVDNVGNVEPERTTLFRIDVTSPEIVAVGSPVPNAAGWNNTPVAVVFSGTDAVSSINYCSSSFTVTAEGREMPVSGHCADHAGWTSTAALTLNIDMTPPVIAVSSPSAGQVFIATRGKMDIGFTVADNFDPAPGFDAFLMQTEDRGSPRGDRPAVVAVSTVQSMEPLAIDDGLWRLVVSATDFADNTAHMEGGVFEVMHDVLPPVSVLTISGSRYDGAGVTYLKRDSLLSLSSLDDLVVAGDGDGLGVFGQRAAFGREGAVAAEAVFQNQSPVQGGAFVSSFSFVSAGWNAADGYYALFYGARDILDNEEPEKSMMIGLDNTPPETSASLSGTWGLAGWHISPVEAVLASTDALSGPDWTRYRVSGGEESSYTGPFTVAAEGAHELFFRSQDRLGNVEPERTHSFKLDLTPPATTTETFPPANEHGWRGLPVIVSFNGADAVSGLAYCSSSFTVTAEGMDIPVSGHCRDIAGWTSTATVSLNIDLTVPEITASRRPEANEHGWTNVDVTVDFTCSDALSGVQDCSAAVTLTGEGYDLGAEGVTRDYAGHVSTVGLRGIHIDCTSPVSSATAFGGQWTEGGRFYLGPPAVVELKGHDPAYEGTASGVDVMEYYVDAEPFLVYSSSFTLAEGVRTLRHLARDKAGNRSAIVEKAFYVDATPPETDIAMDGPLYRGPDGTVYSNERIGIFLSAADPVSNGVASGVLLTRYRLDGGAWTIYAGSFTIAAEGRHTLEYLSLDRVNNAEALKTTELVVDNTPPVSSINLGEPRFTAFGLTVLTPATPVTLTAGDPPVDNAASGLRSISYELFPYGSSVGERRTYLEPFTLPQGTWEVRFWSDDNVGNTEPLRSVVLAVSTLQRDALASVAGLDASGSSDIAGAVRSNATVSVAGSARILGDVTASTITVSGKKAQITGVWTQAPGTLSPEPVPLTLIEARVAAAGDDVNHGVPERYLVDGRLVVTEQAELVLSTGIYRFAGMELSGGCEIKAGGPVDILVEGDIVISGGSGLNAEGPASLMNLFLNKASSVTFTGGGKVAAYFYAPYAHLELTGNSLLGGHYFVKTSLVGGNGNIVQAGEALPKTAPVTAEDKFKISAFAAADASFSVLAGPDATFRLGEVYVFPNPALRGAAPTFHIECGIADSVNIKIYTTSGRFAHETTLSGAPPALDDGNGLSYAYEYAWRDHIPSGVYYYLIEAASSGQKLKKTGKFAVVR